jgi:protease-4
MRLRLSCAALVVGLGGFASGCEGRPRLDPEREVQAQTSANYAGGSIAEIDLTRGSPETVSSSLLSPASKRSHFDLVRTLGFLATNESTKAVIVNLGGASVGLARAEEIGNLLDVVRKQGKSVVCHADAYDNATIFLAAKACSEIWLSPAGEVESVGIAAQLFFANKLLDRLHIGVDYLQVGKYKGAQEPFTRDAPSPEARESLVAALGGLRTAWLKGVADGRAGKGAEAALEDGPFTPEAAIAHGLIDKVGTLDEAREAAKEAAGGAPIMSRFGGGEGEKDGLSGIVRALSGSSSAGTPHIAVVPAIGQITMAPSGGMLPFGSSQGITEVELGRVIKRLTQSAMTKAVVLRIDSPGGSALASDLLWKKLRRLKADKPLVISVGGMAASGGYYLACTGSRIVAEPTSILGSIGVVGGKLTFGKALDEVGVHVETIPANPDPSKGSRAAYMSPFNAWDDPTKARVLEGMTSVYNLFLKRVAEGRGVTVEKIAPSAEGRVFGGVEAKERGLVDDLGGLTEAIAIARDLASLPKDAPVEIIGDAHGLFDFLDGRGGGGGDDDDSRAPIDSASVGRELRAAAGDPLGALFQDSPEIGWFVGALSPLTKGEHTLTAMPFGFVVR